MLFAAFSTPAKNKSHGFYRVVCENLLLKDKALKNTMKMLIISEKINWVYWHETGFMGIVNPFRIPLSKK